MLRTSYNYITNLKFAFSSSMMVLLSVSVGKINLLE